MRPQVGHLPKGTPDLLRGQERLFLPYNARGWEVLPLSFVRGDYWIHFEVDSITLRGEAQVIDAMFARPPYPAAEEIHYLLNGGSAYRASQVNATCVVAVARQRRSTTC